MSPDKKKLCTQLVRFLMAGGLSACIYSVVYLLSAKVFARPWSALAVFPAFLTATVFGFFLHSLWSFRGYGSRDDSGRQHFRYVAVQGVGLTLNFTFTWIVTNSLTAPAWAPLLPCVILTPIATFMLQRQWVFK
jgi:putative flippase GtrA